MMLYVQPFTKPVRFSVLSRTLDFFSTQVKNYAKWRAANITYIELNKLSNRELNDIGIGRSDIRAIANDVWHDDNYNLNKNLKGWV